MKALYLAAIFASAVSLLSATEIPSSILDRMVTEPDWRTLYENLCRDVAKWHTPTHEPDLVAHFWEPLFYLKPCYYFVGGENLGEVEIGAGTWFDAYRGKRVSELVAIGIVNRDLYRSKPLALEEAVQRCLEAHLQSGCESFLAVNRGMGEIFFPGLNQAQVTSRTMDDYCVILHEEEMFVVGDSQSAEIRRRELVVSFMALYNAALDENLARRLPVPTVVTPVAGAAATSSPSMADR